MRAQRTVMYGNKGILLHPPAAINNRKYVLWPNHSPSFPKKRTGSAQCNAEICQRQTNVPRRAAMLALASERGGLGILVPDSVDAWVRGRMLCGLSKVFRVNERDGSRGDVGDRVSTCERVDGQLCRRLTRSSR